MALYKDGNPVSGLNSIPRLTLAQYNALNVKPEFWVRTDAPESYKKLSADQVSYDSNNTVKDMLDAMTNKYETLAIPNIGQHKSIKITLADSDTFCIATFAGGGGGAKNAMYLITASASVTVFQNDYSITKNSDRVFTVTSTDYWSRAVLQIFAPNPNAISYEILN